MVEQMRQNQKMQLINNLTLYELSGRNSIHTDEIDTRTQGSDIYGFAASHLPLPLKLSKNIIQRCRMKLFPSHLNGKQVIGGIWINKQEAEAGTCALI